MKKLILLTLAIVLFTACNQEKRYTQNSPEIDTYKKVMDDYKTMNWEDYPKHYADTAKIASNVIKEKAQTVTEAIEKSKEDAKLFNWEVEDIDYEMVMTDEGETWVNYWGIWRGTLKSSGKLYEIPFHNTARFIDGKIVEEDGYWDNSEIVLDLQAMEAEKNMSIDEKTAKSVIDEVVKAWNANDKKAMAATMTNNFVRTENGTVIASSSAEYGTKLMDVFFGSFPDFQVMLDDYKIIGNEIHINWTCKGTNTKPFQGNPATNKSIVTHGHSIWTIESNGKLSREDAFYDNLTLFNQMGYSAPSL